MILQGLIQTQYDLTAFDVRMSTLLLLCKIVLDPRVYKQNVYRPLDRSTVALQQITHTVDIGRFHGRILAIE
jgi:hypothetical protein